MLLFEEVVFVTRRRTVNRLAVLALALLIGVGLWSFGRGNPGRGPNPPGVDPSRPNPVALRELEERREDLAAREPADLKDLKDAITRTSRALERSSWDEAASSAQEIRQRWVSFKPAMRAQAGTRMWNTMDTDKFSTTLDNLQDHIASRRKNAAEQDVQTLYDIANSYDTTREGPPNYPRERGLERQDADL